jgi:hypothetical protein
MIVLLIIKKNYKKFQTIPSMHATSEKIKERGVVPWLHSQCRHLLVDGGNGSVAISFSCSAPEIVPQERYYRK